MTLTLIGSGETSERLLNLHRSLLSRLTNPKVAFLDTPAGFQLNADEISASVAAYFKKHFSLDIAIAGYRSRNAPPDSASQAVTALASVDYLIAGPGSPTYAIDHWRGTAIWNTVVERWNAGAQLVFASSAAIAISRFALPVYEIYKVGADPFWADGLDLLGPHGFDLAILPHYNNAEGRTYDTRYCFMGELRLLALEKFLPPTTVILGIDENTACTLDFAAQTAAVTGTGRVTIRYQGKENHHPAGTTFDLNRLTAAHALDPVSSGQPPTAPDPQPVPAPSRSQTVPDRIREWAAERDRLRAEKKYADSDILRDRIASVGYSVKDSPSGPVFSLIRYANVNAVPSHLDQPDAVDWSINLLAHNNRDEILRAARSALKWAEGHSSEVVIVDNGSHDGTAESIAELASEEARIRPVLLASDFGEGMGRNAGLRASLGRHIIALGSHMEIIGDIFTPLARTLADDSIGATGSNGLVSTDLFTFDLAPSEEADALEFYLFAFRRERLKRVGLLDEKFVFYRNIDLDWSMAFKDKGLRLVTTPNLPLVVHEHPYLRMDPAERDRLSKKNYRRFLDKWRERKDLLIVYHGDTEHTEKE